MIHPKQTIGTGMATASCRIAETRPLALDDQEFWFPRCSVLSLPNNCSRAALSNFPTLMLSSGFQRMAWEHVYKGAWPSERIACSAAPPRRLAELMQNRLSVGLCDAGHFAWGGKRTSLP